MSATNDVRRVTLRLLDLAAGLLAENRVTSLTVPRANHPHSFDGLRSRLYAKLTAHTLTLCLTRLLRAPNPVHLKALVFPI